MVETEAAMPSSSNGDAATAPAAKHRPSALCRAKKKVAVNISALSALREGNEDEPLVEFADAATRCLQDLLHGRCVSSVEMARLQRLAHDYSRDEQPGTRALLLMGGALRSMSVARNEYWTLADGLEPDEYGLPRIRVKPPRYSNQSDDEENTSPGGSRQMQLLQSDDLPQSQQPQPRPIKVEPLFDEGTPPEETSEIYEYTTGQLTGMTGHVDVSRLPPIIRDPMDYQGVGQRIAPKKKVYSANAPAPFFEYKSDSHGNMLVKSEMMGEDEFFDHQIQMRAFGRRYEAIARTGVYEERLITKQLEKRIFDCDECGDVFPNRHKFAAHKKYAHPRKGEKRPTTRPESSSPVEEPEAIVGQERVKRERRAPIPRDEVFSRSSISPTLPTAPTTTKMYTCPMCEETLDTQHKFASHMRYKHPKESAQDSMVGRRASVTKVQMASTSAAVPSPLATASSKTVSSGNKPAHQDSTMTPSDTAEPKQYACARCGRCFSSSGALGGHSGHCNKANGTPSTSTKTTTVVKEEVEDAEKYACARCGRCFPTSLSLGGHVGHCNKANGVPPSSPTKTTTSVQKAVKKKSENEGEEGTSKATPSASKAVKKEQETPKTYSCRLCPRTFDNYNSLAAHTRHCARRNGMNPSPRSMQIRSQKAAANAAATTPVGRIGMNDSLPMSPLAVPAVCTAVIVKTDVEEEEGVKSVSRKRSASNNEVIKEEPQETEVMTPKPARKSTPASAAATTAAVTPMAFGKVLPALSMSTRSSRSRASTLPPHEAAAPLTPLATPSPPSVSQPPAKRARTVATPLSDREVKQEPEDEEEEPKRLLEQFIRDTEVFLPEQEESA